MRKRILSLLLALVMLASLAPVTARAEEPAFTIQPIGGPTVADAPITVSWETNFIPVKQVLRKSIEHPVDGLVNTYTALDTDARSCRVDGLSSGYYTILAYYSDTNYVASQQISVPKYSRGTRVIFTDETLFEAGFTATINIEAMAELDENLMDAYFSGEVSCQWRRSGAIIPGESGLSYTFTEEDAGMDVQAAVIYGNYLSLCEPETVRKHQTIWVGGVQMDDGEYLATGADTTTTVQPDGGYAYYDRGVLELNNYEYEGSGYSFVNGAGVSLGAAVYTDGSLDVILVGENVLNQTVVNYSIYSLHDLYIAGTGSLYATQSITSSLGDIWVVSGTIDVGNTDVTVSADNKSVMVTGGTVNARIHACYDIEIAAGRVEAESDYSVLQAGRDIAIYGGTVIAKTTHYWADEYNCAIEFGQSFTVAPDLVVRASADPNGPLEPYVADDHGLYDLVVIERPGFVRQPASVAMAEGEMMTVSWETNFQPIRIEIYYLENGDQVLYDTLPGTATSARLPIRDEEYFIAAYYSDSVCAESDNFRVTEGDLVTIYFCFGDSPIATQDVVLGQCASEPEAPAQEGMDFLGWYTADGEYYYFDEPVSGDLYLYAKFGHYVILCFGDSPIAGQGVEHGKCAVEPEPPAQEGMDFLGWYTDLTGGEKFDFSTPITSTIYLYARFVEAEQKNPFSDVPADSFYEEPVGWALERGITTGATQTTFNPNGTCLRAQVVTFLHRAAGSPEPNSRTSPFTDVKPGDFYFKPVLWAVDDRITNGINATTFGSTADCNRAAVVTFLWRAAGSPEPKINENPFEDVKTTDFFYKPVLWAVENGITNGIDATHFGPGTTCNRAQVVTFLYRAYN